MSKRSMLGKAVQLAAVAAISVAIGSAPATAVQSEPDRLLRPSNLGFGDTEYYYCFAQSREAAYGIQVFTEVVSTEARVTLYQMLAGADAAANPLPGRPWRDVTCHGESGNSNRFYKRGDAEAHRDTFMTSSRGQRMTIVEIPWPGKLGRVEKVRTTATSKPSVDPSPPVRRPPSAPAAPKYVEVAGPGGTQRLSPEVAARNQAAADEYRRKMAEHAAAKAEHDRKLALHQQSQAAAAAEQRAYQQKLAMNQAEVAAHGAAMAQHQAAPRPPAKGAHGWMYCDARGAAGDKRRYYSRVVAVDYVPGQRSIIDVMASNRRAFKAYVAGTHSIVFATDSLVHCPYSTTSMAEAEALMARDKRGDATNEYQIVQTGWTPAS